MIRFKSTCWRWTRSPRTGWGHRGGRSGRRGVARRRRARASAPPRQSRRGRTAGARPRAFGAGASDRPTTSLARRSSLRMAWRTSRSSSTRAGPESSSISAASALLRMAPSGWLISREMDAASLSRHREGRGMRQRRALALQIALGVAARAALQQEARDEEGLEEDQGSCPAHDVPPLGFPGPTSRLTVPRFRSAAATRRGPSAGVVSSPPDSGLPDPGRPAPAEGVRRRGAARRSPRSPRRRPRNCSCSRRPVRVRSSSGRPNTRARWPRRPPSRQRRAA